MNLQSKTQPVYFHLNADLKDSLFRLAKFQKTTLSNLLEQGAKSVIHHNLKQLKTSQYETQQLNSSLDYHNSSW